MRFAVGSVLFVLMGCSPAPEKQVEATKAPAPKEKPPAEYQVKFETTKGDFVIDVKREWAPRGADQFFELVQAKFYDGVRFHRVVRGFVCQWGINPDPKAQRLWSTMQIPDDPVKEKNRKGTVSFAQLGPNSRTTQVFINLKDNSAVLDRTGFAVFGKVSSGLDVVEKLYFAYGEVAPRGSGLDPTQIERQGYSYLDKNYPRLDGITRAAVIK
jgi:cyclophilin family peptidyl-prolyl cis-trans isomerase